MSPPKVLRTVAGMPPSSSVFWKQHRAQILLLLKFISSNDYKMVWGCKLDSKIFTLLNCVLWNWTFQ